jgi:ABC-type multidrug transport system fused ATPase/permease subunit
VALATARKVLNLLTPHERRRAYLLLGMIVVMALLEVIGVASILPFLAVLANPDVVSTNPYLSAIYERLGFQDPRRFLLFLGLVVFIALVASILFKAATTYALVRFTQMRGYTLSRRLVAGYLNQPYEWFLNRHSADLGKTVLSEVGQVISGAVVPIMQVIAHGAVVLALLILIVVIDPMLALVVFVGLGGAYAGIYLLLRRYLGHIGEDRVRANRERFQAVQEAFGGVKDVKVSGLEGTMLHRFDGPAQRFATRQAASLVASQLPRYGLEIIAFGGMLAVVLYLMAGVDGFQQILPLMALYAFAGYRLMPALQHVYADLSKLRFAAPALDTLHRDLCSLDVEASRILQRPRAAPLRMQTGIRLEKVSYAYPAADKAVLKGMNLDIPAWQTIGLVGATGSGKTTTVDIILGLLQPHTGALLVDGQPINQDNVRAWQRNVGYVPQHIYLADDTVAANIAFGVPAGEIDMAAVQRAAQIANLHDFVVSELPEGYETRVGERGVRLSGGQRQRIGIARALYHDPQVLIMDEATSALDNLTERAVMDAVHNLGHKKTIILIAHRLSTVRECDTICLLERGRVAGQGTYEDLVAHNDRFREMAHAVNV